MGMKIICLDTETTGTRKGYDEILQLSIISGDGAVLFNQYFKPVHRYVWNEAEEVNGISPFDVKDCKPLLYYKDTIQDLLRNADVIIGYNILGFDFPMLFSCGIENDVKSGCIICDIMLTFASVYGEWNDRFCDYKWQKLQTCAEYYHYSAAEWHNSLDDAKATLYCFYCMYGNPPVIPESGIGISRAKDTAPLPSDTVTNTKKPKKTGRLMIAFGIFLSAGFLLGGNPIGIIFALPFICFGVKRWKTYKSNQ